MAKSAIQDYIGSIEDSTKAIEINPADSDAYYNRGKTYCNIENYTEAIEDFTNAIRKNSKFAAAYLIRGIVNLMLEKNKQGLLDLYKAKYYGDPAAERLIKKYC